jgi:hypothetical protein
MLADIGETTIPYGVLLAGLPAHQSAAGPPDPDINPLVNRYYYGYRMTMSISTTITSPPALRDLWIARQLFVGDLIDRVLAEPPGITACTQ